MSLDEAYRLFCLPCPHQPDRPRIHSILSIATYSKSAEAIPICYNKGSTAAVLKICSHFLMGGFVYWEPYDLNLKTSNLDIPGHNVSGLSLSVGGYSTHLKAQHSHNF